MRERVLLYRRQQAIALDWIGYRGSNFNEFLALETAGAAFPLSLSGGKKHQTSKEHSLGKGRVNLVRG